MKKRGLFILIIVIIIVLLFFFILIYPFNEKNINRKIEKANYCEKDSDCIVINFGCPFGCGSYINKNEEKGLRWYVDISRVIHPLYNLCEYLCIGPPIPRCENNICVPKICELGKNYSVRTYVYNSDVFTCECPEGSVGYINESGMTCIAR